jgi:uncharacterized SAM-binding protein YcdF (DUF218 family)
VFWLKKVVSFWLMPLPLSMALLVCGILLARFSRRPKLGGRLVLAAAALLILLSNRLVSTRLLQPLEARYPAVPEFASGAPIPASIASCQFVVVLGGGNGDMPGLSSTSQLSTSSLGRIVEAVRILRVLPAARLVVSGPGELGHRTHAAVLAQAAESLGIDPARIMQIDTAHDTEDESMAMASIAHGGRTALVTSAWHMPRAAGLFRKAGVSFVPCPADFVSRSEEQPAWTDLGWDVESLERSTRAVHEWIGLLWLRLRGVA